MKRKKTNNIITNLKQSVFAGKHAKDEYINPANHPPTPLIEITDSILNPFKIDSVRIFAKDLRLEPLGQVKSGTVHELYTDANKKGQLKFINNLYEATSGNTGAALALLSEKNVIIYVNNQTSHDKIRILQLLGAQVIVTNDGIKKAKAQGSKKHNLNLDQYANSSNPEFFEKVIAPQIWNQTNGNITLFSTGLGTTGTMVGISKYLKKQNPNIKTIGVIVNDEDSVPGVRTSKRLLEISLPWKTLVDFKQFVNSYDSFEKSLSLIRRTTILAGPSSGFALQGLIQELTFQKKKGKLDKLRNASGEIVAVFPILDAPWLYINDYFEHLDKRLFKDIENEN